MTADTPREGSLEAVLAHGERLLARDPASAAAQAREILRINPASPDAHRLLTLALRRAGRGQEAERAERDWLNACARDPALARAGMAIYEGRLAEAEHVLRPHLQRRPDDPVALSMMAEIANRLGILAEAERLLEQVLKLAPGYMEARLSLARLLAIDGRLAQSNALLDAILQADPDNAPAARAKGTALGQTGDYEAAIAVYEKLLRRGPGSAPTWLAYGHVLKTVGRLEDGVAAYRRALHLDPDLGEVWWSLANLKTVKLGPADIAAMTAALDRPGLEPQNLFHFHFALGKALEDAGQIEPSFRHYERGNRIRRSLLPHDARLASEDVQRSIDFFTPAFFAAHQGQGSPSPAPIFILGMPRAGSTLLEQILSSHSMVEGTSELPYIPMLARGLLARRWRTPVPFPQVLADVSPDEIRALGETYLERAALHRKTGRPHFIDKLPNNWGDIGFIHLILPHAKIIDARRHPLACGFSNYKQHFAQGQSFSYDLADIGSYYADYVRLMRHFDAVLPGRVHRVIHEHLVADPEAEIRRLLDYLELPFEEGCLRFHENERAVRTPSAEQVRRPINREGLDRWRPYEPFLGPLKQALGTLPETYPQAP